MTSTPTLADVVRAQDIELFKFNSNFKNIRRMLCKPESLCATL